MSNTAYFFHGEIRKILLFFKWKKGNIWGYDLNHTEMLEGWYWKALCNEVWHNQETTSACRWIWTWDLVIQFGALATWSPCHLKWYQAIINDRHTFCLNLLTKYELNRVTFLFFHKNTIDSHQVLVFKTMWMDCHLLLSGENTSKYNHIVVEV